MTSPLAHGVADDLTSVLVGTFKAVLLALRTVNDPVSKYAAATAVADTLATMLEGANEIRAEAAYDVHWGERITGMAELGRRLGVDRGCAADLILAATTAQVEADDDGR